MEGLDRLGQAMIRAGGNGAMKRTAALALAALGMLAPLAAGCTRTSDGSIVMRRPSLGGLLHFREDEDQARIVPSRTLPRQSPRPLNMTPAIAPANPVQPTISVPSMSIAKDPPFRNIDPAKPMSCTNTKTPEGRFRVVCT
jgi:hypothetical protein